MVRRLLARRIAIAAFSLAQAPWAASITSVSTGSSSVGKYVKEELTVGLGSTYSNPYDPTVIDLSANFTSPSGKAWKVNGFYDGSQWKIRFAGNEVGTWTYTVTAKDASGSSSGTPGTFVVTTSPYHGWVRVAPNKRYLAYDDGTSFFGIGSCHAWSVTTTTLSQMQALNFNTYVYWNGTYDQSGGNNLIESVASGLGKYDQGKAVRLDNLIDWSEQRGLGMILVLWPHDYLCNSAGSCPNGWPSSWTSNPYRSIVSAANFYSDATAWTYQQKMYRYIIARWGYSRGLLGYQTIDEIGGTDGWVASQTNANAWMVKMADYFQTNDPFRHLTEASQGSYWTQGNAANDLSNTEDYGSYSAAQVASIVQQLWNNNNKPAIMGETGISGPQTVLWSAVANGISINPLLWQFNQGWSDAVSAVYPPLVRFVSGIDFAHLTGLAQAKVAVSGANAYGITSDQITFGYINGTTSGKNLTVTGLAAGKYNVEWWDCTAGATDSIISSTSVTVTGGTATLAIPTNNHPDLAYKIKSTTTTEIVDAPAAVGASELPRAIYAGGELRLSSPLAHGGDVQVMDIQGRIAAHGQVTASASVVPTGALGRGVYYVRIHSGDQTGIQSLVVKE
jgi:hypothetical protein